MLRCDLEDGLQEHRSRNGLILFWLFTLFAFVAAGFLVWPFLPAILWATVFSILLYPWFLRLKEKGWNPTMASLGVTLVPAFVLILPIAVMGTIAGVQVVSYASEIMRTGGADVEENLLSVVGDEVDKALQPILNQVGAPDIDIGEAIKRNQAEISQSIFGPLTSGLKSFVITVVTLVIALLTTFFMVRDSHAMEEVVVEVVPLPPDVTRGILQRIATTVRSVFFAVVVVAIIQGALAGLMYWIAGVPGALVWMLITTLLAMIPLLGAPVVYVPIGLSLLLQGQIWQAIMVLGVGFLVISQIDNLLRPLFIGASTKLHPIPVFFALLGGVLVMGPVGLMAGPMLLTVILALADILRTTKELAVGGLSAEAGELPKVEGG